MQPRILRTDSVEARDLTNEDRGDLSDAQKGIAIVSGQIKDTLARLHEEESRRPRAPGQREKTRTKVDSGACDSVINEAVAEDYPLREIEASKVGMSFVSASGDPMPNLGEKIMLVKSPSGVARSMRNQVVNCTGPLTSVARLIDVGNFVGFCSEGCFILDPNTGAFDLMERKGGCFELELELVPFNEAAPELGKLGFPRQP